MHYIILSASALIFLVVVMWAIFKPRISKEAVDLWKVKIYATKTLKELENVQLSVDQLNHKKKRYRSLKRALQEYIHDQELILLVDAEHKDT